MDDAYPIADLDDILPGLLEGRSRVYYHFGRDKDFDLVADRLAQPRARQVRQGAQPPHEFLELGHLLHELRLFKSKDEVKLMQRAADIACRRRWRRCAPRVTARYEYEVEAALAVRVPQARLRLPPTSRSSARGAQCLRAALPRQQRGR